MKYVPPLTKDGKIQHVAVVIKNKDMLLGFLEAYNEILSALSEMIDLTNEETLSKLAPQIDSSRFNNYIDDGIDGSALSDEEIQEITKERLNLNRVAEHPENNNDILEIGYFSIDCTCGNFISFATMKDVPEDDFKCDICDRTLIQYIRVDDDEVDFDDKE